MYPRGEGEVRLLEKPNALMARWTYSATGGDVARLVRAGLPWDSVMIETGDWKGRVVLESGGSGGW